MYEELVKRLRRCEQFKCRECEYEQIMGCRAKLDAEAADAIEELSRDLDSMNDANIALYGALPKWIPVTERLPEEPYGCLAIVWDSPRYDGDMFLNYYPEFVGWDGETWNDADGEEIPFDVVYWMKMPQIPKPPKEET